jgi:tetratricopeptide (TPR) repeat protein
LIRTEEAFFDRLGLVNEANGVCRNYGSPELPTMEHPLEQLARLERDGKLLFRLQESMLAVSAGQLQLDFPDDGHEPTTGKIAPKPAVMSASQHRELNNGFADAWNNLGSALVAIGTLEDAVVAYRETLAIDRGYGDFHYNLADALEELEESETAKGHWQAFLARESQGQWTVRARQRLARWSFSP